MLIFRNEIEGSNFQQWNKVGRDWIFEDTSIRENRKKFEVIVEKLIHYEDDIYGEQPRVWRNNNITIPTFKKYYDLKMEIGNRDLMTLKYDTMTFTF